MEVQKMELEKVAHKLFQFLDRQNTKILSGREIFPLFSSSGLPTKILAKVWEVSAQGKRGIDLTQFELALRIISLAQNGVPMAKMKARITDSNISVPQMNYPVKFRLQLQKETSSASQKKSPAKKKKQTHKANAVVKPATSHKAKTVVKPATSPVVSKQPRVPPNNTFSSTAGSDTAKSPKREEQKKPPTVIANLPKKTSVPLENKTKYKMSTGNTAVKPKQTATLAVSNPLAPAERVSPSKDVRLENKTRDIKSLTPQKTRPVLQVESKSVSQEAARSVPLVGLEEKQVQPASPVKEFQRHIEPKVLRRSRKNAEADMIIQEAIALQKQSVDLRKRNVLLESEISRLKASSSENLKNVDKLTRENKKLKKRFGNSAKLVKKLTHDNKQFSHKKSELKQRLMELIKTNDMLEKDVKEGESQTGGLNKRLEDNVKLIIELTQQGLEYAKENRVLQYRVNEATRKYPSVSRSTETFEFAKRDLEYSKREFEFGRRDLISRCVVLDPHEDYHQISINALASLSDFDMNFDKDGLDKNDSKPPIETPSGTMTPSGMLQTKPGRKSYSSFTSKKPDDIFRKSNISSSLLMTPGHDSQFAAILSATLVDGKDSFHDFESSPATPDSKSYKIKTSKLTLSDDFHDFDFCASNDAYDL